MIKTLLLKLSSYRYYNHKSKVIYYHDVHSNNSYTSMSTSLELFKKHIAIMWEQGYTIVDQITHSEREVMITFDDGFRGLYENFSYFSEHRIPVKVFLIAEYLGGKNYLSKEEVSELLKTGLVTIGSHTLTHRNLDELTEDEMVMELQESKRRLEDMFGIQIDEFCYPRGRFNPKVSEIARKSGYRLQYSCLPGSFSKSEDIVKRNFVQHESPKDFLYHLQGGGEVFYRRYLKQQVRG